MAETTLSRRGQRCIAPALPYLDMHFEGLLDALPAHRARDILAHPDRPDDGEGYVLLAIAENRLNQLAAVEKLREVEAAPATSASGTDAPMMIRADGMGYHNFLGRARFRDAFARYVNTTILADAPVVAAEHLVVSAGVGALLQHLAMLLCDEGDAVLLPRPTYAALYNDLCILARTTVIDVPLASPEFRLTVEHLDAALEEATRRGVRVGMLLVLNPENPTGVVHPPDEVRLCIDWCREHSIHCVVDEIYANSVHSPSPSRPFQSAVQIALDMQSDAVAADDARSERFLGDWLHVLWGFSKDWAMSGLRVGVLYTHHRALLTALGNVNYFSGVSNYVQDIFAELLESHGEWVQEYIDTNRRVVKESYDAVACLFSDAGIPVATAQAGMFCWIDLRKFLPSDSGHSGFAAERELTRRLFAHAHILLTPGEACHAPEPGFFRCCFAWMDVACVTVGIRRLVRYLESSGVVR